MSDSWVKDYDNKIDAEDKKDAELNLRLSDFLEACRRNRETTGKYAKELEGLLLECCDGFYVCDCCKKVNYKDGMKKYDKLSYFLENSGWVCESCIEEYGLTKIDGLE
jgi:hypothetical protein